MRKVAGGGTAGYIRTRSVPSLVAGVGLGACYGYAGMSLLFFPFPHQHEHFKTDPLLTRLLSGYLLKNNKDYGAELALGSSVFLTASAIPRVIKTSARAPVPLGLLATGSLATYYYQKKYREFTYGV